MRPEIWLEEAPPTPPIVYSLYSHAPPWIALMRTLSRETAVFPSQQRSNQRVRRIHSPLNTSQSDRNVLCAVHKKKRKEKDGTTGMNKYADQPNHKLPGRSAETWNSQSKEKIKDLSSNVGSHNELSPAEYSAQAGSINGGAHLYTNEWVASARTVGQIINFMTHVKVRALNI